jgi:hypothetical protein
VATFTPSKEAFSDLLLNQNHGLIFDNEARRKVIAKNLAESLLTHNHQDRFEKPILDDYGQQGTVACRLVLSRWRRE